MGLLIDSMLCISFIFGPTGFGSEDRLWEIICPESFGGSDLTFDPTFKGK